MNGYISQWKFWVAGIGWWCKKKRSSFQSLTYLKNKGFILKCIPGSRPFVFWHVLDMGKSSFVSATGNTEVPFKLTWLTPANIPKPFNTNRYPADNNDINCRSCIVIPCLTLMCGLHLLALWGSLSSDKDIWLLIYYWNQFEHVLTLLHH